MGILLELLRIFIVAFSEGIKCLVGVVAYGILAIIIVILFKKSYKFLKINLRKRGKMYACYNKGN